VAIVGVDGDDRVVRIVTEGLGEGEKVVVQTQSDSVGQLGLTQR